jgi:uncharacterized protein YraI
MKSTLNLFFLTIILAAILPAPIRAQEPPKVLAFYYAWFDQNTWTSGQSVDLPAAPYASADPAVIAHQVAQASGAGIDALVQSWYGPQVENNQTETNFRVLLDQAAAQGMQAGIDLEVTSPFLPDAGAVTAALSTLLATHARHPAYLRYQGQPVIFFWRQQQYPLETWQAIRDQVDPNHTTLWIAEGVDLGYQAVFDGHHLYSNAWADSPAGQMAKWGEQVRAYETDHSVDRLWVATAMPGYNDTHLPRANAFAVPRQNGDYYRQSWQGAVASRPDMLIITSFNEWPEGTQLEPAASYGNLYLDITRELATALKGSAPPAPIPAAFIEPAAPAAEAAAQDAPTAEPAQPAPAGPYLQIDGVTNVRGGPATSFDIVGRLPAATQQPVLGRLADSSWWQIEFAAGPGGIGWVAAEVVDFVGDSAAVPIVAAPDAPPTETPTATPIPSAVTIPAGGTNVRSGPGLDFDLLGRLAENLTLPVLGTTETGDWWQVEFAAGPDGAGWVADAVVKFSGQRDAVPVVTIFGADVAKVTPTSTPSPTPAPPVIAGQVEGLDAINVRSEPSTEGDILGGFYLGNTAAVLAISPDGKWWQIDFADAPGQPAWVATEFVRFTGRKEEVPIFGVGTATPTPDLSRTATPTATTVRLLSPQEQPTLAPTATSLYQATSAAMLAEFGTPEPPPSSRPSGSAGGSYSRSDIPWGLLAILVIIGFLGYQFYWRRKSG